MKENKPATLTPEEKEISKQLKTYGHSSQSLQTLKKFVQKSHQWHYTRQEIGSLHTALEDFRNVSGLEKLQRTFKKNILNKELVAEEQGFSRIDSEKGDRIYLNQLLSNYARQADESLYQSLVKPRIKSTKKHPAFYHVPLETDCLLLIVNPFLCFDLLNEVKTYQNKIAHKTRRLYIEIFINKWFYKFNRFALEKLSVKRPSVNKPQTLGLSLYRLFIEKSSSLGKMKSFYQFISTIIPEYYDNDSSYVSKEGRNNLRTIYLILINLLLFLLQKKVKVPSEIYRLLAELDRLQIYTRKYYLSDGMRADYEKFHLLPSLNRKTNSQKQEILLQSIIKKQFQNFWKQYSLLPSTNAKVYFCGCLAETDRQFMLEQFYHFGLALELAKLHEYTEKAMNTPEAAKRTHHLQVGSKGNKLLNDLWSIARKYQLNTKSHYSNKPEVVKYIQEQFSEKEEGPLEADEFVISSEDRLKDRKRDWKQLTIHDIPHFTKVKKWKQVSKLSFDLPDNNTVLFNLLPYVRLNAKRVKDRLTIAQCVELCRLPFRYLVTSLETRYQFHFITIGDLLITQITGTFENSSHSLFRFVLETKQISEPQMVELLKLTYPVIEFHFGEMLRENISYVINHRYSYKGGGVHGINVGIAVDRINEIEDKKAIYLSSGKMFYRLAEAILIESIFKIEPRLVIDDLTVERKQLEAYFEEQNFQNVFKTCMTKSKDKFAPLQEWMEKLSESEQKNWNQKLMDEVFLQHEMFVHDYPNPYVLPTN